MNNNLPFEDEDDDVDVDVDVDVDRFENNPKIILTDDMVFPKATIDEKLIKLQKEVTEFITSTILKHEADFCTLVLKNFPDLVENILGTTSKTIIQMITEITNKFYNQLYFDIQNNNTTNISKLILEMCQYANYGPHILLDKLVRITLDCHIEINREELNLFNVNEYMESVLVHINKYLLSINLLHILSKGPDDDNIPFVNVPVGEKPFNIVIEKNIEL